MSEYTVVHLEMNDDKTLKDTLKELGYPFEDHKTPVNLYGFLGDQRQQTANIVIRKKDVGAASNDIGFLRKADGSFEMIVSSFDRLRGKHIHKKIMQVYAKNRVIQQAKLMGFTLSSSKEVDGQIKIKVIK